MKWNDFEKIIDNYFDKHGKEIEHYYIDWKNNPVWKKYYQGNIRREDIDEVITFLKKWGRMDRVIGKCKKQLGEKRFINENISSAKYCQKYFSAIEKYVFPTIDFNETVSLKGKIRLRDVNEIIFSKLGNVLKWTSPSKVMHMVNPKLFLMWDDKIRENWGCEHNAKGYTNFILRMQLEYNELIEDFVKITNIKRGDGQDILLETLNDKINKKIPLTRWIDIYNWMKYTNMKDKKHIF